MEFERFQIPTRGNSTFNWCQSSKDPNAKKRTPMINQIGSKPKTQQKEIKWMPWL
jgi:hypothetical protein